MDEFASSAMMRVMMRGLARLRLQTGAPVPAREAHVPLETKQALLLSLQERYGPHVLFSLGQGLKDMPEEPLLIALSRATDPVDLVERWRRLERFAHSRHRIDVEVLEATHLRLRHFSLLPGARPSAAEDLVVWGVLAALMERIGVRGFRFRMGAGPSDDVRWAAAPEQLGIGTANTSVFEIRWDAERGNTVAHREDFTPISVTARALLDHDPCRAWTVGSLAVRLGLSSRTLQRRLAEERTSFHELLTVARLAEASRQLIEGTSCLAEVGYLSGFADQAHFTRAMKRHTAMTPVQFRDAFAL